ncbi:MAG: hypothetical protein IT368_14465, partial [Candidatus Hydrogenedentes bacterium]|nr:hypothetical protein [Candidatus Hydrogenedentota bacterium]
MIRRVCLLACCAVAAAAAPYDVPELKNITIDGAATDWGDGGFQVQVLPDAAGKMLPPSD